MPSDLPSETFCILPFTHLSTTPVGNIYTCCRSKPLGMISDMTIRDAWNSDAQKQIRLDLLAGKQPDACKACWELERVGAMSMRDSMNQFRTDDWIHKVDAMEPDGTMPFDIPFLELKLTNLCNLRCRMCYPGNSSRWMIDHHKVEHITGPSGLDRGGMLNLFVESPTFYDDIATLAPHFDTLEFAGGEPLIDPVHYRFLDTVAANSSRIRLKYSTNLTRLGVKGFDAVEYFKRFKSLEMTLSIDGTHGLYEYIRTDGNLWEVEDNVRRIKREFPKAMMRATVCVSAYNILNIVDIMDYFTRALWMIPHSNRVGYPGYLSSTILPGPLKDELRRRVEVFLDNFDGYVKEHKIPFNRAEKMQRIMTDQVKATYSRDDHEHWKTFIEYTNLLDESRGTKILEVIPEFEPYWHV